MESAIIYDGSFKGLLSAVFYIYEHKLTHARIYKSETFQPGFFGEHILNHTDPEKADRVWTGVKKKLSAEGVHNIYLCFLSELENIEDTILAFIQLTLAHNESIERAYGHASVLRISQVSKMVNRERHRMKAFIRFRLTSDGIYFTTIEPDFNVIPLLITHFKNRYADQKWIIYDIKRKYGIYYDLETVAEVELNFSNEFTEHSPLIFNETEELYQILWRDYFKHINIPARKNTKLHLQHVPKRYWKLLTEKQVQN